MLNSVQNVQECDAKEADSSNVAGYIKILKNIILFPIGLMFAGLFQHHLQRLIGFSQSVPGGL